MTRSKIEECLSLKYRVYMVTNAREGGLSLCLVIYMERKCYDFSINIYSFLHLKKIGYVVLIRINTVFNVGLYKNIYLHFEGLEIKI